MFVISWSCEAFIVKVYRKIKRLNVFVGSVLICPVRAVGCGLQGGAGQRLLLVRPQESRDFAAYQTDEGAGEHLVGLPSGVLKVVVWVSQYVKKSLNQFFVLQRENKNTSTAG